MPIQRPARLARRSPRARGRKSEKQKRANEQGSLCASKSRSQEALQGLSKCLCQWLARQRVQKARRKVSGSEGEEEWLKVAEAALAGGLRKNGLTLKLASHVEEKPAKNARGIPLAGLLSEFLLKHQKQLLSYPQKKKANSKKRRQVQKKLAISINAENLGKSHGPKASQKQA